MRIYEKTWTRRPAWALLAGISALLSVLAFLTLLFHLSVLAEPTQDLTVQKEAHTAQAGPGDTLTYTIRIRNNLGSPASGLWLTDTLVGELAYVSASLTATVGAFGEAGATITWTGSLSSSEEVTVTFAAQITSTLNGSTYITNTAYVTGTGELIVGSFGTEVKPGELEVSKSVSPSSARPDEQLAYTIHITNVGYGLVESAWMSDDLPAELAYVAATLAATGGTFGETGGVITWTGSLGALETATVSFAAGIVPPSGEERFSILNTVDITGAGSLAQADATATVIVTHTIRLPLIFYHYPPIPDLNDIPEPDPADNSYTVSWQAVSVSVDRYVLQEAADANFSSVTEEWQTTATSQLVTKGTAQGALYYRVRADDDDRWGEGPWSGVESVALKLNYYDSFSSSSSGWRTHTADCCLTGCDDAYGGREHMSYKYDLYYSGGRYHVYIPTSCYEGGNHGFTRFVYPVSLAPGIQRSSSETCLELKGSFEKKQWVSSWGLVFASNSDMSTHYDLWVDDRGDWGIVKRTGYQFPGPNHSYYNETRTRIVPGVGGPRWPVNSGYGVNTLRVRITGDKVRLYINGEEVHTFTDGAISSLNRVGIIGGNWEWGDTRIGYDYFYVDEGCDTY